MGRSEVTIWDLLGADSVAEFQRLWARYEADPIWLIGAFVVAVLLYVRFIAVSPLDKRSPERGTFYLGNIRLGQNPKADAPGPLRTRLQHDPEYERDDPLEK